MTVADLLRGWGVKEEYIANFIGEYRLVSGTILVTKGRFMKRLCSTVLILDYFPGCSFIVSRNR